jgi:hypothetical protein
MFPDLKHAAESDALAWLDHADPVVREAALDAVRRRWQLTDQDPATGSPEGSDPRVRDRVRELEEDADPRVAAAARRSWGSLDAAAPQAAYSDAFPGDVRALPIEARVTVGAALRVALWQEARRHDPDEIAAHVQHSARMRQRVVGPPWLAADEVHRILDELDREERLFRDGPGRRALAQSDELLRQLVGDPSCRVRFSVLSGLWRIIADLDLPVLVTELEDRLGEDACPETAARVAMAVAARHDSPRCADAASEVLASGNPDRRSWLAHVASPPVVAALLGDDDPQVRHNAAKRLAREREPVRDGWTWHRGLEVVNDGTLDPANLLAEFESLWDAVLPERTRRPVDPEELWAWWRPTWRACIGSDLPVESWLVDFVGEEGTSPTRRFAVLEELLMYGEATRWGRELLATAGTLLVVEAVDADWFPSVWEPWRRVLARLPAQPPELCSSPVVADPYVVARMCWAPPRAMPPERHVEFWRRTGHELWRSALISPVSTASLFDPTWRGRLTSLGLTAERALVAGSVPEQLRLRTARVALYAPEGPLAVRRDGRTERPGREGPPPTLGG